VLATTNPAQGVAAGEFDEFVQALRAEAAYANVHTAAFGAAKYVGRSPSTVRIQ